MSPYDVSLIKLDKGYGAIQKGIKDAHPKKVCHMLRHVQNKICIPKEGMPHAHKACQKKEKKRCIPKEGMPHTHKVCQKKERKRKYSPYQKYYKGEII